MVSSLFWRYKMKKIRELRADEIEVRVGVVRKKLKALCCIFYLRKQCINYSLWSVSCFWTSAFFR